LLPAIQVTFKVLFQLLKILFSTTNSFTQMAWRPMEK